MNRRNFALSWGRKLFFGISWPLSSILALVYLRSFILPETVGDGIYFATAYIGHFGILNAIVYFLLYCPVILLMPSYYISRFWSLLLILSLNLFILIDALTFSTYHHHIYSYLGNLFLEVGTEYLVGKTVGPVLIYVGLAVFALLIWLRGEMIWRSMQGRFSNPVKNWYLGIIALALVVSKLMFFYGDIHPKLSQVFPLDVNFSKGSATRPYDNRKFYYPTQDMSCTGKQNPNVVLIVIKEWGNEEFKEEFLPLMFHLKRHALSFNSHTNVSMDPKGGLFSLLYSIPSSYQPSVKKTLPALFQELEKRKYEMTSVDEASEDTMAEVNHWIENRSGEEIRPYYLSVILKQHSSEAEKVIHEVILALQREDLLKGTHILITGAYSASGKTPFLYVTPDRRSGDFEHSTSHYDVMPSLMEKIWNCKKVFKAATAGFPLEQKERDWMLVTGPDSYRIIDLKNNGETVEVKDGVFSGQGRKELIFPALKLMTKYSRPD